MDGKLSVVWDSNIQHARKWLCCEYIPKEMWYEILSRLDVKNLLKCQSVSKYWKHMVEQIRAQILLLPQCGLFLMKPGDLSFGYVSTKTKEVILQRTKFESLNNVSSGYDVNGVLGNLLFDFSALYIKHPHDAPIYFATHRGLILRVSMDYTYRLSNPATKQAIVLPKSPIVKNFTVGAARIAMVVRFFAPPVVRICYFAVVRLCRDWKLIEIYYSQVQRWAYSKLVLDNGLLEAKWYLENYVAIQKNTIVFVFFLTNKNHGVVVKFKNHYSYKIYAYGFCLPEVVEDGYNNARLGDCGGCLHLSYYNEMGVWIWKHEGGSTGDAWVLLFEISNTRQLCKPVALGYIAKSFLTGSSVLPMGFHHDFPIVFFSISNFIFAYDLIKDTIDKIVEINDEALKATTVALPYLPCLDSFYAQERSVDLEMRKWNEEMGLFSWKPQMGPILADVLLEQLIRGNKEKEDWKLEAYQAAVDEIMSKLGLFITVEHVKSRINIWKKDYGIIMDIRTTTKFWDKAKKMVRITPEEFQNWMDYCENNQNRRARWYQNKAIKNWEDMCALFVPDKAMSKHIQQTDVTSITGAMNHANKVND